MATGRAFLATEVSHNVFDFFVGAFLGGLLLGGTMKAGRLVFAGRFSLVGLRMMPAMTTTTGVWVFSWERSWGAENIY